MTSLKRLLHEEKSLSGSGESSQGSKKIRSQGGQETFVPGYEVDYVFQADKSQIEPISLAGVPIHSQHDYTLKRKTRDTTSSAVSVIPKRKTTIS